MSVNRTSAAGDCDLYVKANGNPSRFDYQYYDITVNPNISVTILNPSGIIWYIGVYGMLAFSSFFCEISLGKSNPDFPFLPLLLFSGWLPCQYTIAVTEQSACGCVAASHGHCEGSPQCICDPGWVGDLCDAQYLTLSSAVPSMNNAIGNGEWQYYKISTSASSALSVTLRETNTTGYVWIFLSHGVFPSLSSYDYSDKNGQKATHQISFYTKTPQSGDLYIGVYGSPFIPSSPNTKSAKANYNLVAWVSDF